MGCSGVFKINLDMLKFEFLFVYIYLDLLFLFVTWINFFLFVCLVVMRKLIGCVLFIKKEKKDVLKSCILELYFCSSLFICGFYRVWIVRLF